jgi:hypothetical protein
MKTIGLLMFLLPSILPASSTPLDLALAMIARVSVGSNAYVHRPLVWSLPADGEACFRGDCSGVLVLTFREAYGWNAAAFRSNTGAERPLSKHLYDSVGAGRAFLPVERVGDLRAGDWLFVRYLETNKGRDTGHVMLVASNYEPSWNRVATPPLVEGTLQVALPIIDSTIGHHGTGDSRAGGGTNGGIGLGFLRLYVTPAGNPVGYAWTLSARSVYRDRSVCPMRMARLSELWSRAP